jgi:hypothetical protein
MKSKLKKLVFLGVSLPLFVAWNCASAVTSADARKAGAGAAKKNTDHVYIRSDQPLLPHAGDIRA